MGGTQLPLSRVRCLSGRHPGSKPGRGKTEESDLIYERTNA